MNCKRFKRLKMFFIRQSGLSQIARGINITEGYQPYRYLPEGCKWYDLVQVVDYFNDKLVEQFLERSIAIIKNIKKDHTNLFVLCHYHTGVEKILQEKTGVKCFSSFSSSNLPVDYSKIDGFISICRCTGLDCKPGKWIVPKYYLPFDVEEKIIYNEPQYTINHIKKYLPPDFEYIDSPILTIDDDSDPIYEWNPDHDQRYLILDREAIKVLNFVRQNTKMFDQTHDWIHAVNVAINSTEILDTRDVLYLALLHDVCDHKYPESMPRSELSKWINENIELGLEVDIDSMIDLVSFSKQNGDMTKVHPVLEAVRDGDRMEAIGEIGIFRCEEFGRLRGQKIPDHVIQHSYDKLLKLVPEGFIVNHIPEAIRRHKVLEDYIKYHTQKV